MVSPVSMRSPPTLTVSTGPRTMPAPSSHPTRWRAPRSADSPPRRSSPIMTATVFSTRSTISSSPARPSPMSTIFVRFLSDRAQQIEVPNTMREYRIAAIPADGIGKEVIAAGLEVMKVVEARDGGFRLAVETFPWGSDYYRKHGRMMAEDGLAALRGLDFIYFGAVGDKEVPDHITLWGLRLPICQGFDQYANLRPARILPGIKSPLAGRGPADLDWVIIRENSEGEYAGNGGRVHRGLPADGATQTAVFTRAGVERIMRFAFDIRRSRPRRHLTVVTKSNAQRHGMVFLDRIPALVGKDYPEVAVDKELVDAMTTRMVL